MTGAVSGDPYAIVQTPLVGPPVGGRGGGRRPALATALIESQCPAAGARAARADGRRLGQHRLSGERRVGVPLSAAHDCRAAARSRRARAAARSRRGCRFRFRTPVWFGRPDATYQWPFLGYRRLDGARGERRGSRRATRAPRSRRRWRGSFARCTTCRCAEAAGVGRAARRVRTSRRGAARADGPAGAGRSGRARHHRRRGALARRARSRAGGAAAAERRWPLVHGDFYSRHILVDERRPHDRRDRLRRSASRTPGRGPVGGVEPCCRRVRGPSSSRSTARWTTARAAAARLRALTSGAGAGGLRARRRRRARSSAKACWRCTPSSRGTIDRFLRAPSSVVEHLTFNQGVPGSIPGGPTTDSCRP